MHRIKIHQGEIAALDVEAIVSSRRPEMDNAVIPNNKHCSFALSVGNVVVVADSGKIVLEAIGPFWRGGEYEEEQLLASCYSNAMSIAKQHNVRSIAFTPISCGPFGFRANRASRIAVEEVILALRRNPLIESVVFCCFDPVTTALYRTQVGK